MTPAGPWLGSVRREGNETMADAGILERERTLQSLPVYRFWQTGLLTDFYQLTMMYGYFKTGQMDKRVVFDLFYRANPGGNGYVICAGLEQAVLYLRRLRFTEEELAYLDAMRMFDADFMEELRRFRFTGTVYAIPEGTVVFPQEPLLRIEGRIFELQLVESALLCFLNHQSLIATKAARLAEATRKALGGDAQPISEFGLRRAQNADAALFGARAAYIGGCSSTSNVAAGLNFGIPVSGTQSHSWVQSFDDELEAFRAYVRTFPDQSTLLVDTYSVLRSGLPNAITVGKELRRAGYDLAAIRIDSGDLAYLSKAARRQLDEAGFAGTRIVVSDDLDEDVIRDLILQGAPIDAWGIGTALITAKDAPALGGVYKLAAEWRGDRWVPRIKVSENPAKVTNPGKKKIVRFYVDGLANADLIMLDDEPVPAGEPVTLFDPVHTYKQKTLTRYRVRELMLPVIVDGELVYRLPELADIRQACRRELDTIAEETRRPKNPHVYHVDLSRSLWDLKQHLMQTLRP